jgi:NodT family efflux transporter outer membrane factor (OMF) lipoprotein
MILYIISKSELVLYFVLNFGNSMRTTAGSRLQIPAGSVIVMLTLSLLFACTNHSPPAQPNIALPQAFSEPGSVALPVKWWTVFDNDELNKLIEQSSQSNFDLLLAWERLQAARALLKRETSLKWPQVDSRLQGQLQEPPSSAGDSWELGLYASYEVDLWGRIQSSVDAERFRTIASEADYQTAFLTLSAEIALTYLELLTAAAELDLIRNQLETNGKIYDSLKARFGAGQGERGDLLRQAQLVEASRGQLYLADAQAQLFHNQLAVLTGRLPAEIQLDEATSWPELPELPQTGLPSELIQRRPDIAADFNRLQAADRDLAVAVYPRISLNASAVTEENDFTDIFDEWVRRLAGNVLMPVLDGGGRRAEVERNQALRNQRLYAYSQSVLVAIQEVEDALVLEANRSKRLASLKEQVRLAGEAQQQLQLQYFNGAADFLDVLTAVTNEQRLRRDLLNARMALFESRIALYRAIAGPIDESTISQFNRK